jgi:hypothetical protein
VIAALLLGATLDATRTPELVPVTVTVTVVNRERKPLAVEFPTPDLFFVQLRDAGGKTIFDSRSGHKPIPIHRTESFPSGRTKVALYNWSGLTQDRGAPAPGSYVVHVEMQTVAQTLVADVPLTVEAPTPIVSLSFAKRNPATIAGTVEREGTTVYLRDDSGRIVLSRPLGIAAEGTYVVRGTPEQIEDRRQFLIERFAPANPTPRASAAPASPDPRR